MPKTKTLSSKQTVPILTPAESRQVRACLDLLQEAQNICELAARQLCAVRGFANEWSRLSKPCDALKRAWHDVEARRQWLQAVEHKALAPAVSMPDDSEERPANVLSAKPAAAGEDPDDYEEHCPDCGIALPSGATCCSSCPWSL